MSSRSRKPYKNNPILPEAAMKPVTAAMAFWIGGQTKQAPEPSTAASAATQAKDHRTPENTPPRMPRWAFSQVRSYTKAVSRPSRMPPNTPVSTVWMPSTMVWPALYRPVSASGCASRPNSVSVTLPAVR